MLINSEYKVFEACAKDQARPTLACVSIVSDAVFDPESGIVTHGDAGGGMLHGRALATDGFILAVVPVLLDANDQDGLIGREAMAAAFKASKRLREPEVRVGLDQVGYVVLADGAMIPRTPESPGDYGRFPDVDPVIPSKRLTPAERRYHLMAANFNWGYMRRCAMAIGCKVSDTGVGSQGSAFPRLVFGRVSASGVTHDPILIEPASHSVGSGFVAPFGLLMPMVDKSGESGYWAQD